MLSAGVAAFAGALMAHYSGFITPAKASFMHSVELVIMVVFGGMGLMEETGIERLWRDARVLAIGGGATEVMLDEAAKRY